MTEPPRWRTGDAARAADASHKHVLSLIDRGVFRLADNDIDCVGAGPGRAFTRESIYRLATTVALSRAGLHARVAARLADQFSTSPLSEAHAPFMIASLQDGPHLLVDEPSIPTINLVADVAAIVAAVDARLAQGKPHAP